MSESKFLQSLCALLGAAVLVGATHVFLLATSAPRLDAEQGFTGARPSTRAVPSAPPAALEAEEPHVSEPVDPVPEIDVAPAPSEIVRHSAPDAAKEPPVRREFEITSPGDTLVPQPGDPDYFAAAADPQIVAEKSDEAELYASVPSPGHQAVEPVTFGLGDPIDEADLAEIALDDAPVSDLAGIALDEAPEPDFAETIAPKLDEAPTPSPKLGKVASPEPRKLAALKPRPVPVFEAKTSALESTVEPAAKSNVEPVAASTVETAVKGAEEIVAAPPVESAVATVAPLPAERTPPLPLRKPKPEIAADTLPAVTVAQQSAITRPGWQPLMLGLGRDKKAAPAAAPRAAAPAKPEAEKPAAKARPAISGAAYRAKVWAALSRHRPRIGQPGSTTVVFTVGPRGALRSVRVGRSSGDQKLDQRALAAVRSAAPFPAPPGGLSASALTYSIQIYFR